MGLLQQLKQTWVRLLTQLVEKHKDRVRRFTLASVLLPPLRQLQALLYSQAAQEEGSQVQQKMPKTQSFKLKLRSPRPLKPKRPLRRCLELSRTLKMFFSRFFFARGGKMDQPAIPWRQHPRLRASLRQHPVLLSLRWSIRFLQCQILVKDLVFRMIGMLYIKPRWPQLSLRAAKTMIHQRRWHWLRSSLCLCVFSTLFWENDHNNDSFLYLVA